MLTLSEATKALIAVARDDNATVEDHNAATDELIKAAKRSGDLGPNLRKLSAVIADVRPVRGAMIANLCGFFVERGADPHLVSDPVLARTGDLLGNTAAICDQVLAKMPTTIDDDVDQDELFDGIRADIADADPASARTWKALEIIYPAAVAVLANAPELRGQMQAWAPYLEKLDDWHPAAGWLSRIVRVLHNEPILVINAEHQTGFMGRISGVGDNFQLHVLLMMAFFKRHDGKPRSLGSITLTPDNDQPSYVGRWNMYSWKGFTPEGRVSKEYQGGANWIWGEGAPADIPEFEGRRVIVLGPPAYDRSWNGGLTFPQLTPTLTVDDILEPDEVASWMSRMIGRPIEPVVKRSSWLNRLLPPRT